MVLMHRPENPLADAVQRAGGVRVSEAIATAEESLEELRAECMANLDVKIAEIDALTTGSMRGDESEVQKVYALSNEILNEAGMFGMNELSEAGRSLCDLSAVGVRAFDYRAVRVHVEAMKSLRRPEVEGDAAIRAAVLEGLRQVTSKMAASARG